MLPETAPGSTCLNGAKSPICRHVSMPGTVYLAGGGRGSTVRPRRAAIGAAALKKPPPDEHE